MGMTIAEILEHLRDNRGRIFPRQALEEAIERRDEIIPELLKILEDARENIQAIHDDEEGAYMAHIYAMHLLVQFRETRAYPLVVAFFSVPGDISVEVTGDVATEDLGRILASIYDGDIRPIKQMVEDPRLDEYVRSAALETFGVLYVNGLITREEVLAYYKELYDGKLERKFSNVWNKLADETVRLYPEELYDELKRAYEEGLVEPFYITFDSVKAELEKGKEQVLAELKQNETRSLIDNVVDNMASWACFRQPEKKAGGSKKTEEKKIGKNARCPCGSGKKYKKCCMGKDGSG